MNCGCARRKRRVVQTVSVCVKVCQKIKRALRGKR